MLLWLRPIVEDTAGHTPRAEEVSRALERYARELDVGSLDSYSLAPEVFGRSGAVAVAALVAIPLAAFASRSRWAAYVVGGSLPILLLTLAAFAFPSFADLVSLSQARRIVGFMPLSFAFAGGCAVLAGFLRGAALPAGLAAGLWLQLTWAGDFGPHLDHGGPAFATWVALVGAALAIPAGILIQRRWGSIERRGLYAGLTALLFVLPVAVHGMREWEKPPGPRVPLTPGLREALGDLPEGTVVFSDLETSYRIAALAPVYVAAAPPAHVADTEDNRPYARRRDVMRFLRTGDLEIPREVRRQLAGRRSTAVVPASGLAAAPCRRPLSPLPPLARDSPSGPARGDMAFVPNVSPMCAEIRARCEARRFLALPSGRAAPPTTSLGRRHVPCNGEGCRSVRDLPRPPSTTARSLFSSEMP